MESSRRWAVPAAALLSAVVVGLGVLVADRPSAMAPTNQIGGPFARLLAESADLGPARGPQVQITAALNEPAEPVRLMDWADVR
jgi:kumamolisin